jgi:hypothetical protein
MTNGATDLGAEPNIESARRSGTDVTRSADHEREQRSPAPPKWLCCLL